MATVTKAVIPAAGFGTRMLPAAKAIPKEMLPVIDRPVIQYVMQEVAAAGLTEAILVTAPGKEAIENHFRSAPGLEARLASGGRADLLASINEILRYVQIRSVLQHDQKGLGHAVLQAEDAVGNEPFACLLGDTIFTGPSADASLPLAELSRAHAALGGSIIGLELVPAERVGRYGIIGGEEVSPSVFRIRRIVEKPSPGEAPSRLAVAARYILSPAIFECLKASPPGKGGEIQLTDGIARLIDREPVHGVVISARRHDIGNPADWLLTNIAFATRDPTMRAAIERLLLT